jgi:hypothetical protein
LRTAANVIANTNGSGFNFMHHIVNDDEKLCCMQLKRLVARQDSGQAASSHLSWRDMLAILKDSLRDLKLADNVGDSHLKRLSVYSIAREATGILERAASLSTHRISVRFFFFETVLVVPSCHCTCPHV